MVEMQITYVQEANSSVSYESNRKEGWSLEMRQL